MAKKRPTDLVDSPVDMRTPDPKVIQEMVKAEDARFYAAVDAVINKTEPEVTSPTWPSMGEVSLQPEPATYEFSDVAIPDEKPIETTEIVSQNVPFAPEPTTFVTYASSTIEDHLKIIDEYRSITVPTFRDLTLSGREAVTILAGYVADGLVERSWQSGYGIYSLTPAGKQFIASS